VVIVGLNVVLIGMQIQEWAGEAGDAGWHPAWVYGTLGPIAVALAAFLGWITLHPVWARQAARRRPVQPPILPVVRYPRIGVAVEFTPGDEVVLAQAAALASSQKSELVAIHVVEGMGADYHGAAADDEESRSDRSRMQDLVLHLRKEGLSAEGVLGYGSPPDELVRISQEQGLNLLVLGTHGHRFFADLALGQTVSPVLHRLNIPVLVVPQR
jgi:manganese transport protein